MAPATQIEVSPPPNDAVTRVVWAPDGSHRLLVSSWDRHVHMYEVDGRSESARLVQLYQHPAPVLDVCFGATRDEAFSAGMDHQVKRINLATGEQTMLSTHTAPVRCVVYCPGYSLLISASWDSTLHIHHLTNPQQPTTLTVPLPGKPHAIAASPTKLVVSMSSRIVHIFDIPTIAKILTSSPSPSAAAAQIKPWQEKESSLKFLTRAASCMPNDAGYALSSIEGRVSVEWFDDSPESQARKYAFKCHRKAAVDNDDDAAGPTDMVYPVNALSFHPVWGTFVSGGGDGTIALWDAEAKRRMKQYVNQKDSVASLAFSQDGKYLAIATCPGFEDGMEDYSGEGLTAVTIREMGETEAKGKKDK